MTRIAEARINASSGTLPTSSFHATFAGAMRAAGSDDEDTHALRIAGVRAGDRAAFEAIYRAYWPRLVAFARHYGARSMHDAQEIVQDIFLAIWRNRAQWDVRHGLTAYRSDRRSPAAYRCPGV